MASIAQSNKHLKDPKARENALIRNVVTSSAIDGIRVSQESLRAEMMRTESAPSSASGDDSGTTLSHHHD